VTVDGVDCVVTATALDSITCVTGAAADVSITGPQPGSPGLTQTRISGATDFTKTGTYGSPSL